MCKHAIHHGDDLYVFADASHDTEEVNRGFKATREEAGAGEEEVADRSGGEIEGIMGRASAFEDLLVEVKEGGPEKFALGSGDWSPEGGKVRDYQGPFGEGWDGVRWEAVV